MQFYGFLSNSYTSALVTASGSIDWFPAPRFDSGAVFCRLLDQDNGGFFQVQPTGSHQATQSYLPGTNILQTLFHTHEGKAALIDYLVIGRPEIRRVAVTTIPLTVTIHPAFDFGRVPAIPKKEGDAWVFLNPSGSDALSLTFRPGEDVHFKNGLWHLPPGRWEMILRYSPHWIQEGHELDNPGPPAAETLRHTVRYWREAIAFSTYRGPHREALERSLLVIKGLTYRTTGAIIAAPTTSLPEILGETRQWDYRFAWIRDGAYATEALLAAGDLVGARRFLEYVFSLVSLSGKPFPNPFFQVDGTAILGERELPWLAGYQGSTPVRVGNAATAQNQMDVEGTFLWAVEGYFSRTGDHFFLRDYWWAIDKIVSWVAANRNLPDASLWEFRGREAHYTHSRLMVWVALKAGARLAAALGHQARAAWWQAAARQTEDSLWKFALSPVTGRFQQSFESPALDCALLTLPLYGFLRARDPRFTATLEAIEKKLVNGPFVFRYREDMLGKVDHPFLLASFWLARVYLRQGKRGKAAGIIAHVLDEAATDLGLMGEHHDRQLAQPRGNFPQLFPHAALVLALLELAA